MTRLDPDRWREVSPHLDDLLDLSIEERAAWLERFRGGRPELAELLEQFLEEHRKVFEERFLEHSAGDWPASSLRGQRVGPYTLVAPIGQGGMGCVWSAERSDGRFERRVAIKFLRTAVALGGGVDRFRREGRILAQLGHPHIAQLIDAGLTLTGEPYLVLEHIEGEPIDSYCDSRGLDVDRRLRLFLDVLDAVSVAHAHLVVHRDIKPSNVLVRTDGQVKLLDFGIAKLLEESASPAATMLTREGAALTPLFAAPEQLTYGATTTATDGYALGVLLYVLLTGVHPSGAGVRSTADVVKAIIDNDAPLASDVARGTDSESAEKRATTPDKLARRLRGDLDTIIAKAVKKQPSERYASVAALRDDLQRYLANEPIAARPDSVRYRARKYVGRHRIGVGLAAGLAMLLTGFSVVQAVNLRRITRERDRSNRIAEFMTNMFRSSDPSQSHGNRVTAREVLDKASKDIERGLSTDPELQAQMMNIMGDVYDNLGLYPSAEALLTQAIDIRRRVLGATDPSTLESERLLGWVLIAEGRYAEAERLERATLDADRRVLGAGHPETVRAMSHLGVALSMEGRYVEGEALFRQALHARRRASGAKSRETLSSIKNLGAALFAQGRYAEAETLYREAVDGALGILGPEDSETMAAMNNLATSLRLERRYAESEEMERRVFDTARRVYGPEHSFTLALMSNLGVILRDEGRYIEADTLIRQALDITRRVLGPEHTQTAECIYDLGTIAALQGKPDEALSLLREAVEHGMNGLAVSAIERDEALKSLRADPRFGALVAYARKKVDSRSLAKSEP